MKNATLLLILVSSVVTVGHAASSPPANLLACSRTADPGERLRCYDTQMAAMGAAVPGPPVAATDAGTGAGTPAPAPAVTAAAPVTAAPAPVASAQFGNDDLKLSKRPQEAASEKELQSTLTAIKQARPDLYIMVLANGQIWMEEPQGTQGRAAMFFKPGFDVRIEKGLFNHYKMWTQQTGEKNWVTVSRVQ